MMYDKLFASMILPVQPEFAADGAVIRLEDVVAEVAEVGAGESFFGGYAEDFLADLGLDMLEQAPEAAARKAKIQG